MMKAERALKSNWLSLKWFLVEDELDCDFMFVEKILVSWIMSWKVLKKKMIKNEEEKNYHLVESIWTSSLGKHLFEIWLKANLKWILGMFHCHIFPIHSLRCISIASLVCKHNNYFITIKEQSEEIQIWLRILILKRNWFSQRKACNFSELY